MRDIVYILKDGITSKELVYSLRSVEKNFPHRYVWFVGGQPLNLIPDRRLKHEQQGPSKWDLIKSSMLEVIKQPELTDEFYLFNDDFFVMKPFEGEFINYADRSLTERVNDFIEERGAPNRYARTILAARDQLLAQGYPEVNFEVHLPMLFEKSKVEEALEKCTSPQMRSVYGNITGCRYIQRSDVKVNRMEYIPDDPDFVSTNDNTFAFGNIGRYIRQTFDKRSRFEL